MPPPLDAAQAPYREQPPFSRAAVAGFIFSLLILPFLTQILGLIFGLIGVFNTRGRRLRGKGLAIAAIVLSLLFATAWAAAASFTVMISRAINVGDRQVLAVLKASGEDHATLAQALYEDRCSETFKGRVSREAFAQWSEAVRAKHGQLQAARRDQRKLVEQVAGGGLKLNYIGEFVNGPAAISIHYAELATDQVRIENFTIDGASPGNP